ncbi:MAG TPA: MFS transporter [Acidimicrobiales bacterium]
MRSTRRGFAALRNRNFRLYLLGQTVSQAGTWMQVVGQAWLVLHLTDSGTALGVVIALQALPVLLFAPLGGLVADRVDKRKLLIATQVGAAMPALALWLLTASHNVELWMVYVVATALGFVNVFDNPARQAFVLDIVGADDLTSAVSLNNVNFNAARILGPALAGITIDTIGIGPCFLFNALSYGAVVVALLAMRQSELHPSVPEARGRHQLRDGLAYVRRTPELFVPICMMFLVGTLTYETQVTIPLLAKHTFHGDAGTFSAMTVAMGIGAVVGGMLIAVHLTATRGNLLRVTAVLGLITVLSAAAPTLGSELVVLTVLGASSVAFLAVANSTLQLSAPAVMRGRVMSLWTVAFLGSSLVGAPLVGAVGQHFDPRLAILVGGVAPLLAAAAAWPALRRLPGGLHTVPSPHVVVA